MRSIADNNEKTYLEQAPKAEEHPNAGASMLYNYSSPAASAGGRTEPRLNVACSTACGGRTSD